jgi:hypothetical protein
MALFAFHWHDEFDRGRHTSTRQELKIASQCDERLFCFRQIIGKTLGICFQLRQRHLVDKASREHQPDRLEFLNADLDSFFGHCGESHSRNY